MDRVWIVLGAFCLAIVAVAYWQGIGSGPQNIDFALFWNTARAALGGEVAEAYAGGSRMAFAYPPPFLLFVTPLGLLRYEAAFALWMLLTGAAYLLVCRKWLALANPAVVANGMVGQNGLLTSAIMVSGLGLLSKRPALGGAILGLMVIKPQLALLLPVAVIAGRRWRAIPAALATVAALLLLSLALFGTAAFAGFLGAASAYREMLDSGNWPWRGLASVYALLRWFGLGQSIALALQLGVGAGAAVAVWIAWRRELEGKVALTAAASLLASPYLFTYDAALLVAPLIFLWSRDRTACLILYALVALPVVSLFGLHDGPNAIPLAAIYAVAVIGWRGRARRGEAGHADDAARPGESVAAQPVRL